MGTWGYKNFENDAAFNWVYNLGIRPDLSTIEAAVRNPKILDKSCHFADLHETVIAAEILAGLIGYSSPDLPQEIKKIIEKLNGVTIEKTVLYNAILSINIILDYNFFKDAWSKKNVYDAWRAITINLRERLNPKLDSKTKEKLLKEYSKIHPRQKNKKV